MRKEWIDEPQAHRATLFVRAQDFGFLQDSQRLRYAGWGKAVFSHHLHRMQLLAALLHDGEQGALLHSCQAIPDCRQQLIFPRENAFEATLDDCGIKRGLSRITQLIPTKMRQLLHVVRHIGG